MDIQPTGSNSHRTVSNRTDVLVIGAGPSGALVTSTLAARGITCHQLEAGRTMRRPLPVDSAALARRAEPLLEIDELAWAYRNATGRRPWSRVRATGGRSLVWGGWCDAPEPQNLRDARAFEAPWPISAPELERLAGRVIRWLHARRAPISRSARRVERTLGLRVLGKLAATSSNGLRPWLALDNLSSRAVTDSAVALRLTFGQDARTVTGVEWRDTRSGVIRWTAARTVVLCASAVESARLLSASLSPAFIRNVIPRLGRHLADHLISSVALVRNCPASVSSMPGPRSETALIPRFINTPGGRHRDYRSAFVCELRGPFGGASLADADLALLGVDRVAAPQMSYFSIHALGEAAPSPRRYITFDAAHPDSLGRPIPVFHQALSAEDHLRARDMDETVEAIAGTLARPGDRVLLTKSAREHGESGQETGTCVMGTRRGARVTDPYGAVDGLAGVYVADGGLLPTGLDRHPTVTTLALALRVAERIGTIARGEA